MPKYLALGVDDVRNQAFLTFARSPQVDIGASALGQDSGGYVVS